MSMTLNTRIIGKFRHRVVICSQTDVVTENCEMRLTREGIYGAWAMITPKAFSMFSQQGDAVLDPSLRRSHIIVTRYNSLIDITATAWIYEKRLKSSPRWYKVLSVGDEFENSQFFQFNVKLMQSTHDAIEPSGEVSGIETISGGIKL